MGVLNFLPIQEGEGTPSLENVRVIRPALHIDGIGDIGGGTIDTISGLMVMTDDVLIITPETQMASWNSSRSAWYADYSFAHTGAQKNVMAYSHGLLRNWNTAIYNYMDYKKAVAYPYGSLTNGVQIGTQNADSNNLTAFKQWLEEQGSVQVWYVLATPIEYHLTTTQLHQALDQLKTYFGGELPLTQMSDIRRRIIMNEPHLIKAESNSIATFNADIAAPLKECKVYFEPVQEGEGDPSPDNIRPITGWTGIELTRSGKNLFNKDRLALAGIQLITDPDSEYYGYYRTTIRNMGYNATGIFHLNNGGFVGKRNIGGQVAVSIDVAYVGSGSYLRRFYTDGATGETFIGSSSSFTPGIKTCISSSEKDIDAINIRTIGGVSSTICFKNLQVEFGSEVTEYEDSAEAFSVDWSTIGEISGGYVDLVTGEVWKERNIVNLGTLNWAKRSSGVFYSSAISDKGEENQGLYCTHYPYAYVYYIDQTADKTINDSSQVRRKCICLYDSDYSEYTEAEFKAAMSGIMCVYKLAEPVLVATLTPPQLKTLRGINNIWSNANGKIELSYWTH